MTANVLEHRRAKSFAEALEAHQTESRPNSHAHDGSPALAELLAMTDMLGALPEPKLDPDTRVVQRAQLMAAFEQEWADGGAVAAVPHQRGHRATERSGRSRWGCRILIGGLVAGVAVSGFAGAATASTNALPGDAFYGMKRGLEDLRLGLAGSDTERGELLLDQAATRLDEAKDLLGRSDSSKRLSSGTVDQVRQALDDMHAEAVRGRDLLRSAYRSNGSPAPMRKLAAFADGEDDRWQSVESQLPPQLVAQAGKVNQLLAEMDQDVAQQPATGPGHSGAGQAPQATGSPAQGGSSGQPSTANHPGADGGSSSAGAGGTGTGTAPSSAPAGVGGLVSGLTNGLTGNGGADVSPKANTPGSPAGSGGSAGSGGASAPAAAPSSSPDNQGINVPPLLPGLLPGLTL